MTTMTRLAELREQRVAEHTAMQELVRTADGRDEESRGFTAEENQEYERREQAFQNLTSEIERRERLEGFETNLSTRDVHDANEGTEADERQAQRGGDRESEEYRDAFAAYARGGDRSLTQEQRSVLNTQVDAEGGFVVPDLWASLHEKLRETSALRQYASVYPVSMGGVLRVPREANEADKPGIVPENALIPDDADEFDEISIGDKKIARITKASIEMVQDSMFPLEAYVGRRLGFQTGLAADEMYFTGTGNGATGVQGLFPGAPVGPTGVATVGYDQVIDLIYSVSRPYRNSNSIFICHDLTVASLRKIKDGDGRPLWEPNVKVGEPDIFAGYPIITSQFAPQLGAARRSLLFGDIAQAYWIKDVAGYAVKYLEERYAELGQVAWRGLLRTGGAIVDPNAVRVLTQAA